MRQALFSLPEEEPAPAPAPVRQKKTKERSPAILVRRKGATLVGLADMDVELITRFDADTTLQLRVVQERHAGRHRLYWAILTIVARNLETPMRPEWLHGAVKLMLGVSVVVPFGDRDVLIPGSIAFDSMSEPEFRDFLDRFLDLVVTRLLPGVDPRALALQARDEIGPDPTPAKRADATAPANRAVRLVAPPAERGDVNTSKKGFNAQ